MVEGTTMVILPTLEELDSQVKGGQKGRGGRGGGGGV